MLELVPGDFKLSFRALMLKTVEPYVFDQYVQAVNKSTSGGVSIFPFGCGGSGNMLLLKLRYKVNSEGKWMHVTEVIVLTWDIDP